MDPDLSEFEGQSVTGPPCGIVKVMTKLTPEQQEKLTAAIARTDIAGTAIARVVRGWGVHLGEDTVNRHRRGVCRCD